MKRLIYHSTTLLIIIPMLFITTDNGSLTSGVDHSNGTKLLESSAVLKTTDRISTTSNSRIPPSPFSEKGGRGGFDNQSIESSDWYSTVTEKIKKEEYHITYSEGVKAYQSPNRAQNLRFIYAADGFTAKPRTTKILSCCQDYVLTLK